MSYLIDILAVIILILFSLVGFVAIFFTTFGTLIIMIGALIYAAMTGFDVLTIKYLIILLTLYFCGEVSEYLFIIIGGKKFGASNRAIFGALIGAIVGAILGTAFFGVGILLGTFFGIFLGAFIAELFLKKDIKKSLKAGTGGVLGRAGSIVAKLVIAIVMLMIIGLRVVKYSF